MLIVFLLLRGFTNSYRLHTPYAQSRSLEHPPASSLHSLLTDQWGCPANNTASVRPLRRAHALRSTPSQRHQTDCQVCQQQNTTHDKPPPQRIYTVVTILILATISKLQTQTLGMHLHSERIGITAAHPPHSLPLAQGVSNIQALEDLQPKPGSLRPVRCFHMCQCNTIASRYREFTHFYKAN